MSFESHLKVSLEGLAVGSKFEIHDINSSLFKCSKPLIAEFDGETLCRHRLILVSTKSTGFLCGLETYEYTLSKKKSEGQIESDKRQVVYISKVDTTTTLGKFRGMTGRVVQSYISSLSSAASVFVFARAQPQYLFAESAENKSKNILSDRELVSWWLSVLNKVERKCEGWWSVPGIENMSEALVEIGARKRGWKSSEKITWHYGTSYKPDEDAGRVIPRFIDDAKSRLLKSTNEDRGKEEEKLTVADFWNILAYGEECGSGKVTGFFELKLNDCEKQEKDKQVSDIKNADFTVLWNEFMSLDFHNLESTIKSTETTKKLVKEKFPNLETITIETIAKSNVAPHNPIKDSASDKRAAVNVLSGGFIKRKKV